LGFEVTYPPHLWGLWIQWCNKISLMYHHLWDKRGMKI
jgi:hypothetical protein